MWANPNVPNLPDFLLFVQNDMQIPGAALPINLASPAAPGITAATTGGSLATGTVYVSVTYVSAYGETLPSPAASVAITGPTGQVTVTSPTALAGATGYNVYAGVTAGSLELQNAVAIGIGTNFALDSLAAGTVPPAVNGTTSPWLGYAFNRAMVLVLSGIVSGLDYTLAVYNCAAHILIGIAPDQAGQNYFATTRGTFDMLDASSGVISSSSDQGTSNSFAVPAALSNMTIGDLWFYRTPWGRAYLSFAQDFGAICGLS